MTAVIYARYSSDNQRGGLMTFNTIQHMLNNRRYIGELKYRDVLIPDAIPSLVSAELFNDVQEKMLKNKKAPARRKAEDDYLLTTKLDMSLKDQRQALVDTFINSIYLYDDKVLITFNYEDAKKQTLAKIGRIYDEILNRFQAASGYYTTTTPILGRFPEKEPYKAVWCKK